MVAEFQELIDSDPVVHMYLHQMIAQVPRRKPYRKYHLESVEQLMRLINAVLTMAPEFGDNAVITPLGALLDWTMGTPAGFAAFRDPRINAALKKILTVWCMPRRRIMLLNNNTVVPLDHAVHLAPGGSGLRRYARHLRASVASVRPMNTAELNTAGYQ